MKRNGSGARIVASSALICAVLGSIHAFSVFLAPMEAAFAAPRAQVSLTYSLALVALTLAVLLGPRLYTRVAPGALFVSVGVIGAAGALVAGLAGEIAGVWLGYSALFGAANGLGYGFALQYAARAMPERQGLAMGIVTAAYALGAAVSPAIFVAALAAGGLFSAMATLAGALLLAALLAGWVVAQTGIRYAQSRSETPHDTPDLTGIAVIWLAYGTGVAAGLMAIGHAAGFAELAGLTPWLAPAVLALCNLGGSLVGGHLADRFSQRAILTLLPLLSVAGLATLALWPAWTLLALGLVGFAYGGTIAAYPAVIAARFPGDAGPRVYGQVFTAWGTTGLFAPWVAGRMFDQTQDYGLALWTAVALAALSAGIASRVFRST